MNGNSFQDREYVSSGQVFHKVQAKYLFVQESFGRVFSQAWPSIQLKILPSIWPSILEIMTKYFAKYIRSSSIISIVSKDLGQPQSDFMDPEFHLRSKIRPRIGVRYLAKHTRLIEFCLEQGQALGQSLGQNWAKHIKLNQSLVNYFHSF